MKTTLLIITGWLLAVAGWLVCGWLAKWHCRTSSQSAAIHSDVTYYGLGPIVLLSELLVHCNRRSGKIGVLIITLLLCASAVVSAQTGTSTGGPVVFKASDFTKPQPVSTIKHSDFFRSFGPATIITTSVCGIGQMSDVAISTGYEGNAFLRGPDGRMNRSKAIPLKLGACVLPLIFEKHVSRKVRIILRVTQIGIGALGFYDAAKNWKVNR